MSRKQQQQKTNRWFVHSIFFLSLQWLVQQQSEKSQLRDHLDHIKEVQRQQFSGLLSKDM